MARCGMLSAMSAFWSANSQHAALPRIGVVELFSQHAILANGVRSDSSDPHFPYQLCGLCRKRQYTHPL